MAPSLLMLPSYQLWTYLTTTQSLRLQVVPTTLSPSPHPAAASFGAASMALKPAVTLRPFLRTTLSKTPKVCRASWSGRPTFQMLSAPPALPPEPITPSPLMEMARRGVGASAPTTRLALALTTTWRRRQWSRTRPSATRSWCGRGLEANSPCWPPPTSGRRRRRGPVPRGPMASRKGGAVESVGGGWRGGRGRHGHVIRLVGGGRGECFSLSFFPVSPSDFRAFWKGDRGYWHGPRDSWLLCIWDCRAIGGLISLHVELCEGFF